MRLRRMPHAWNQCGFTLFELLVVIVIIGVMIGFAVLAPSEPQAERVQREAQRLAALIQLASDEAILDGRTLGIAFQPDGYRFMSFNPQGWQRLTESPLQARSLPKGLSLELEVQGRAVAELESDPSQPQVLAFSTGELTPFHARVRTPDGAWEAGVKTTAEHRIELERTRGPNDGR